MFGGEDLLVHDFVPELFPVPAALPARGLLACALGLALIVAGLCIALGRRTRLAARVAAVAFWSSLLALHVPLLVAHPTSGGEWTCAFEVLAIGAGAATLGWPERPALGRLAYGAALPAFAVLHVIYRDYVASVIPGWIPGHMFWAYATGAAHLAAGIALVTDMRARLAAILAGFMFGSCVVILHLPRAIGAGRGEWTSLIVALAMTGGAWSIARYGMGDGSNNG